MRCSIPSIREVDPVMMTFVNSSEYTCSGDMLLLLAVLLLSPTLVFIWLVPNPFGLVEVLAFIEFILAPAFLTDFAISGPSPSSGENLSDIS